MRIHTPSEETDGSNFSAYLNNGGDPPFAVVTMGSVLFYTDAPEECDAAIRVWVTARELLQPPGKPGLPPGPAEGTAAQIRWAQGYIENKYGDMPGEDQS
jgi:hypothetical protein